MTLADAEHNVGAVKSDAPRIIWVSVLCAILGMLAVLAGSRFARSALVDIGPTDGVYVRDFREIEKDGTVFFRWTSIPSSTVIFPVAACGDGSVRLRVRRHFVDPAILSVSLNGRVLGHQEVMAGNAEPYSIIEFPFTDGTCTSQASVLLESSVDNARPLGVALDWIELKSYNHGFPALGRELIAAGLIVGLIGLALTVTGARLVSVCLIVVVSALTIFAGTAANPVATERMLRGGSTALILTLLGALALARIWKLHRLSPPLQTALVLITLVTLVSRSAFLHPQAFYPDYRVHALVQNTLEHLGPSKFLDRLFEIQYARSLGLQQIDGRWYPFPYPPGAYFLASATGAARSLDSLDAITITAIAAAALIPLLTVCLGIVMGVSEFAAVVAAFVVALHPLLVRRMALGYFPSVISQAFDALALLILLKIGRSAEISPWRALTLCAALGVGFLVYTQSIANFGLLISTLLILDAFRRGGVRGMSRSAQIGMAALLALAGSYGIFYSRYEPVLENVRLHRPQAEAKVLDRLEDIRRTEVQDPSVDPEDLNDPYAGSSFNPVRGVARLATRLWRFNGVFLAGILVGAWMLLRQSDVTTQNLILAWGSVAVWISVLAAGLPSPNGFQHLKDLEFVTPLTALTLGVLTDWFRHRRWLIVLSAICWLGFALVAFRAEWTERLIVLAGR
ncbi:MAG: hypothetical protein ABI672_19595 [Vicinamibacteria bacterium]